MPPYIKEERARPTGPCRTRQGKVVLLGLQVLVGFHVVEEGKEGRGRGRGKGGRRPLPYSNSDYHGGRARPPRVALLSLH